MKLPYGASEEDLRNCVSIIREITGKPEAHELAINILNIVEAKGGDYSDTTIRAFAEAYLKKSSDLIAQ